MKGIGLVTGIVVLIVILLVLGLVTLAEVRLFFAALFSAIAGVLA